MINSTFIVYLILCLLVISGKSQFLQPGFYSKTCPKAEVIVRSTVKNHFIKDPTIAAGLLRLHAHDCFVEGCDGSILISGPSTERTSYPSVGLRGFEVVDDAKAKLESLCPGVVSCADILTLASRDAVVLTGGPNWRVPLGRRDGRVSSASDVPNNMASPLDPVAVQRQKFASKGLSEHDLVTLVGAHTLGHTDCQFFQYRIYNFTPAGNSDPSINPTFLRQLQSMCPKNGNGLNRVALNKESHSKFDASFFNNLLDGNGVLESDQRLLDDAATRAIVRNYAGRFRGSLGLRFELDFPKAMIKMSNIGVKTGVNGEIRKICSKFN